MFSSCDFRNHSNRSHKVVYNHNRFARQKIPAIETIREAGTLETDHSGHVLSVLAMRHNADDFAGDLVGLFGDRS